MNTRTSSCGRRRFLKLALVGGAALPLVPTSLGERAPGIGGGIAAAACTNPTITSVSGTLQHASSLTIKGACFGTKSPAAPIKYDAFEVGTNGSTLTGWTLDSATIHPQYSSRVVRPNSRMSAAARFVNGNYRSSFGIVRSPLPRIYFDAWIYYDVAPTYSRNYKVFRVFSNTSGAAQPNLYYNLYCQGIGDTSLLSQDGVNAPVDSYRQYVGGWSSADFAKKWVHLQGYLEQSSPTAADGTAKVWLNGKQVVNRVRNWRTRTSSTTTWNRILFGNYLGHDGDPTKESCGSYGDAVVYWDNVYVDTTQARVELGNAATYAGCTQREIQIPSTWTDTAIAITLNQGGFTSIKGRYLYVITPSGLANSQGFLL
jgi:hypothetical protein